MSTHPSAPSPLRVALLGGGTVGGAVARALLGRADHYAQRAGRPVQLLGVAVRDTGRPREGIPTTLLTDDPRALAEGADVVVEVMGGSEPAGELIEAALRRGAQVVTANKQLVARRGEELHALAAEHGAGLHYEAAVMAAVPVMAVVRESLAGDEVTRIRGIVNGSTNYVLDLVGREGVPFADAVRQAGELGYLEADPTEDLQGLDAAAKIAILARTAWGVPAPLEEVEVTGIADLTDADFADAARQGGVLKLVASAERDTDGRVRASVRPLILPAEDPLAQARGGTNVVELEAALAGPVRLVGAGAGGDQTASAVLGDVVRAGLAAARR
ncbi:homoserine dehydrogenase [Serinicoccus kebangsaanensis]|uniref:homoserine dehydrogenase n=1 Tax=Serinicoccus kebangsaanensis TaxID=2602069 RepID=UPI00124C4F23|nr:homoserine dehydrogenase [Serinicoccus kebangsaanensis]